MIFKCLNKILLLFLFFQITILFPEGFVAGTLIKTKNNYVTVDSVKSNDLILTYNFKSKIIEESKVKAIKLSHHHSCISILFNNETLIVSPDHKFYCPLNKKRWTLAKDIRAGDYILKNIKELIKIDHSTEVKGKYDFYCLSVENNHNYFVSKEDIFVHNFVTIPVFTYVIGEGLTWAGAGKLFAAMGAFLLGYFAKKNDIDVSGLNEVFGVKVSYGHKLDSNKINHIINNPEHGFLESCNAGGPDEDPDEWIRRIKDTFENAKKNSHRYPQGKTDISTHWKSSDPKYGELIVRLFKVRDKMELSTAFLKWK